MNANQDDQLRDDLWPRNLIQNKNIFENGKEVNSKKTVDYYSRSEETTHPINHC